MKRKMYEITILLILSLTLMGIPAVAVAATPEIKIILDGKIVAFPDAQPYIDAKVGRTLIPIKFISESLGGTVAWDATSRTAALAQKNCVITLVIGQKAASVKDTGTGKTETKSFDAAASIKNDRTFVPLRFVSETMGFGVSWNAKTSTATIRTDGVTLNANGSVNIAVNGKAVTFTTKPIIKTTDIYALLKPLCAVMKADVQTASVTDDIVVTKGDIRIQFLKGKNAALLNGNSMLFTDPVTASGDDILVPIKFLTEKLGGTYKWDTKTNTANITMADLASATQTGDGLPAAKTAFTPYLPALTTVDPAVATILDQYADNKGVRPTPKDMVGYESNAKLTQRLGITEVTQLATIAKGFLETYYNADYRTVDDNYLKQLRYYFISGAYTLRVNNSDKEYSISDFTKMYTQDLIKYKVVVESHFDTDTSMVYEAQDGGYRVRGRLTFRFTTTSLEYFTKYGPANNLKQGQWYYVDTEVELGQLFGQGTEGWDHSYWEYINCHDLSSYTEVK